MIPWCHSPLRASACQPTDGVTFTFQRIEVRDHPASLGVTCDQHIEFQGIVDLLNRDYRYMSLDTQIPRDAGLH